MAEPRRKAAATQDRSGEALAEYKTILRRVLDSRPSGTRQRLAEALGKNRSFISQISNPAYSTPIPAQHIEHIVKLCHFSPGEKAAFMDAYGRAHPRRARRAAETHELRRLVLQVPDLGDPGLNDAYDHLVAEFADKMGRLLASAASD
ncbi:MAG: hypothetical protein R3322_14245 [Kiloniellales bacterium]|nr:hypothetical protein [Kiloniellales bacterium]